MDHRPRAVKLREWNDHARAKTAGAEIAIEIKDEDHGGRGFSCGDLKGHLWSFGTYDPW